MRCKNCGWNNPPERLDCEKCNSPLSALENDDEEIDVRESRPTSREIGGEDKSLVKLATNREGNTCPKCGYPLMHGANFCPQCGYSIATDSIATGNMNQTVMPGSGRRSHCTLTMLADGKEDLKGDISHSFSGDEILLNRENTDPENNTITSKVQAVLTYTNKHWYIQDKSELKTTYVRPDDSTEIKDGDIIVLGDRRFRFNA